MWETPQGDQVIWQIVLPKALRPSVLHQLHNTLTAGHLAVAKTLNRVRENVFIGLDVIRMSRTGAEVVTCVHPGKAPHEGHELQ